MANEEYKIGQVINKSGDNTVTVQQKNIYQLGIQAPKGSTIILNNISDNNIIMGEMGIFEIPLNLGIIIDRGVEVTLPTTENAIGGEIIIDYLYKEVGEI